MSQNYDDVEEQIGNLGDESKNLGKIKHKELVTGKKELSDSEQDSLNEFMARSRKKESRLSTIDGAGATPVAEGWIPLDRSLMGIRSMFYPENWDFYVRPATVQAIKNWTSIDEERPEQVNQVFNEIIKLCVRIDTHSEIGAGWSQINSWDRFWFIMKVHDYTFTNGQSKIEFDDECEDCGSEIKYTLSADSLFYEFPDEDLIEKYWNGSEWHIDPEEYDVNHDPIILYTPKLGKDEAIIDWATSRARNKQKIDETFIKYLVWLLNKPSRDPQILDRQIQKIYSEYKNWDSEMFLFMTDVINNITINPSEKLKSKCPHCGSETVGNVQFPNGVKSIFTPERTGKKFGSK